MSPLLLKELIIIFLFLFVIIVVSHFSFEDMGLFLVVLVQGHWILFVFDGVQVSPLYLQFQQMFRDGQSDNCDVRKYEKVTGFQLDSCYVAPIYGLVPDDTICDFRAGYMTRTQYCGRGFWFTVQDHRKI